MKKINYFLMVGFLGLLMVSCDKENAASDASYSTFQVNPPSFATDSKAYLDFTEDLSRILFEQNDILYVNSIPFKLHKQGDGASAKWYAERNDGNNEPVKNKDGYFYSCYANGTITPNADSVHYAVNFVDNYTTTSGIILAGYSESNVIDLSPSFAVLVFKPKEMSDYTSVRVGFSGSQIPKSFTISASDGSISDASYYGGITLGQQASDQFLYLKQMGSYFYTAVPIEGSSASTKLYMEYTLSGGTIVKRATKGTVTLEKGKVYMLPDETRDGYAFDSDGAGVGVFSVSSTKQVKFSAGNLQCVPKTSERAWQFAPHQYDLSNANGQIGYNCSNFIDLFGYGTSGVMVGSAVYAYLPYSTSGTFYSSDLAGTNADWGVANSSSIMYGQTVTTRSWRTLTSDEWTYLLSRTGKKGGATVNGLNGCVLLPDSWSLPDGLSFSTGSAFSSNTYTIEQWDKMEKAGAVFLPAGGSRSGTTVTNQGNLGYYWSASAGYHVIISGYSSIVNSTSEPRLGESVRLVSDVN